MILLVPLTAAEAARRNYLCAKRKCIAGWAPLVAKNSSRNFYEELQLLSIKRLTEALGLARRQNQVICGTERLTQVIEREPVTLLSACDAAPRTREKFVRMGAEVVPTPLDSVALGRAIGQAPIIALTIEPGRHAEQAAHWLRVWYEAHPASGPSTQLGSSEPTHPVATRRDTIDDVIEVVR